MGACRSSYIKIDKKLQNFHDKIAKLPAPVLSCNSIVDCDCPARCGHLDFHPYLRDRLHYNALNHFAKSSHKKKFKYDYLQLMTYMQNFGKNWSQETCGSDDHVLTDFDCLTVCVSNHPSEMMNFLFARLGDSGVMTCDGALDLVFHKANKLHKWVNKWAQ